MRDRPRARPGLRPLLVSLTALILSGCLATRTTPIHPSAAFWQPRPLATPVARTAPVSPADVRLTLDRERGPYREWRLELPSVGDNRQPGGLVRARYLEARTDRPGALVVVLPIWGSSRYPSIALTRFLRRAEGNRTLHVLRLDGSASLVDWQALRRAPNEAAMAAELERAVDAHMVAVQDIRRLIDWATTRPEVDRSRIGLAGFSIGAIVGALVAGQEPRIWKSALVMGGAMPESMFVSCGSRVGRARKALKRRFDWTDGDVRSHVGPLLSRLDPTPAAGRIDPRRVLYIEADWDRCMPVDSRDSLWRALGRPEKISIRGGHHWAFLSMTPLDRHFTTRRIRRFFLEPLPYPLPSGPLESS